MIKAILIDIDDTLLDFGKCAKHSIAKCFADFGADFHDYMFPVFEEVNSSLWLQLEKGQITKKELYGKRWTLLLNKFGIKNINGNLFEEHFLEHLSESAEKISGAEEILKYLSDKYEIYAVSNGPHEQQLRRLRKSNLLKYFTDIFTSELLGVQKPEKAFYDLCFEKIRNVKKCEAVLIGDSLTADIYGGEEYGLTTVWFNKKNIGIKEDIHPSYTVNSLEKIKDIL